MRTETGGPTSVPVLGWYRSACWLDAQSLLHVVEASSSSSSPPTPPYISPLPWVHGGLPIAAPDISIGVATAQSSCDLHSGFDSLSGAFQLHGCGEGLLLCISSLYGLLLSPPPPTFFDTHTQTITHPHPHTHTWYVSQTNENWDRRSPPTGFRLSRWTSWRTSSQRACGFRVCCSRVFVAVELAWTN